MSAQVRRLTLTIFAAPVLAFIGFRIGVRFSLTAVVGGGLAILLLFALSIAWIWVKRLDLGVRDLGPVLAAVNGIGSDDPAVPPVKVRVTLVPDKIIIVSFPGGQPVELATIPVSDVSSIVWRSKRTFREHAAQVWLTSRSHSPITLQLSSPGNSGDLDDLRRTLERLVPDGAMTSGSPRPRPLALWISPSLVAILAVFALVGAVRTPPPAATAGGSPVAAVPSSTISSSSATLDAPSSTVASTGGSTSDRVMGGAASTPSDLGGRSKDLDARVSPADAPGYLLMTSPDGVPLTVGAPWSRPCAALSLQFDSMTVPTRIARSAFSVVQDLEKRIPMDIAVSDGTLRRFFGPHSKFDRQPPKPWINGDYVQVPVTFSLTPGPGPGGTEADWLVSWHTLPSRGAEQVTFDYVIGKIPTEVGVSGVLARKAVRMLLARSFGLMYSDDPDSGLQRSFDDSVDRFSAADINALRVFSGCGQG